MRSHTRYALRGNIPGTVRTAKGKDLEILPIDISQEGMGLMIDPGPKEGQIIKLSLTPSHIEIELKVIWSRDAGETENIPGMGAMKRCGLQKTDDSQDLLEIFAKIRDVQIDK